MSRVNWTEIKNKYISDETISFVKLAELYPMSVTSIAERARKEGWTKLRQEALLKISEKFIEKTTDTISSFQADKLKAGKYMVGVGLQGIKDHQPRNARESKEVVETGYKIATEAMGLDKANAITVLNQTNNFVTFTQAVKEFEQKLRDDGKIS